MRCKRTCTSYVTIYVRMEFPLLERPSLAQIQFDYKTGKTTEGWPMEHIKAGTLSGLVSYLCFYATRQRRPELVGKDQKRLGLDPDFCKVFWTMLPTFTTPREVVLELCKFLDVAWADGSTLATVQVCEALSMAVNPINRMFLWLSEHHRAELLYGASTIVSKIKLAATVTAGPMGEWTPRHRSASDGRLDLDAPLSAMDAEAVLQLENQIAIAKIAMDIASGSGQASPAPTTTILSILAEALTPAKIEAAGNIGGAPGKPVERLSLRALPPSTIGEALPQSALSNSHYVKLDLRTKHSHLWGAPYASIAAQWTYIEHHLFRAVPAGEWLACGWDKPRYEHAADAIRRYIDHFNATSLWVTAEVLSQDTPEERAAMIVRLIKVAVLLKRFNNFSALVALTLGLRREPITRLRETWKLVPPAAMERLTFIYSTTDDKKNYRAYKETISKLATSAPVVPHLGAHTAELTMQDQLLPTEVTGPGNVTMLHFRRFRELFKLTMPLVEMQENGYEGTELPPAVPSLINMLSSAVVAFSFAFDEDRDAAVSSLESRSKALEPDRSRLQQSVSDGRSDEDVGSETDVREYVEEDGAGNVGWVTRAKSFFVADKH
jgi:hypothetical protein